jgi:threonylcarbamoyladenosine tRNA methylthiotransferase MtaB
MVVALAGRGVLIGDDVPDVVVVNTCAVTSEAAKASRKLIRRSVAEHPGSMIVVTGCYAVAEARAVMAIPGVDHVVPNADKDRLVDLVAGEGRGPAAGVTSPVRVRANLKVQTGCDELCSFCIVPQTRGELFSRPITQVSEAARTLVEAGTREIILTGVHLGKYGWDLPDGTLIDLIRELTRIAGLERIRLSSIEASQVDRALLEVVAAEPKICRHLHLPLQTGDDRIWKSMRRPGSLADYLQVAELAKEVVGDVTLTTDVMVGFPGEDDRAFLETVGMIERLEFRKLHVFRYSPRPGTPAAADGRRIPSTVVRHRATRLRRLGDRVRAAWMRDLVGHHVRVLVERVSPVVGGSFQLNGLTDNYLRVRAIGSEDLVGRTVDVLVTSAGHDSVEGELVG